MDISFMSTDGAILTAAFFMAGVFDSVCGGGGIISASSLMMAGIPPHFIVGTNAAAIAPGAVASLIKFVRSGKKILWRAALAAAIGSMISTSIGARLNMMLPEEVLHRVLTILIPIAAIAVFIKRDIGSEDRSDTLTRRQMILRGAAMGLTIGIYQGFYGAGAATFYLLAFCAFLKLDLLTSSGCMRIVALFSLTTSMLSYAAEGLVIWSVVPAICAANIAGNIIGTSLALRSGAKFIRPMFYIVFVMLLIKLFLQ